MMRKTDAQSAVVDLVSSSTGESAAIIYSVKSSLVDDSVTIPVSVA